MSENQIGAAAILAVIGLLLLTISGSSRETLMFKDMSPFADRLSRIGLIVGAVLVTLAIVLLVTVLVLG